MQLWKWLCTRIIIVNVSLLVEYKTSFLAVLFPTRLLVLINLRFTQRQACIHRSKSFVFSVPRHVITGYTIQQPPSTNVRNTKSSRAGYRVCFCLPLSRTIQQHRGHAPRHSRSHARRFHHALHGAKACAVLAPLFSLLQEISYYARMYYHCDHGYQ